MSAVLVSIAEAIKTEIDGHDFGLEFTPERSYADWDDKLEDLGSLKVDVVPVQATESTELETRGSVLYECMIDIGIRKRFGVSEQDQATGRIDVAEIDRLLLLWQDIFEYFAGGRELASEPEASWKSTAIRNTYVRKHLREHRQFTGIVRQTYRLSKALPA